jgi:hypothetical protein
MLLFPAKIAGTLAWVAYYFHGSGSLASLVPADPQLHVVVLLVASLLIGALLREAMFVCIESKRSRVLLPGSGYAMCTVGLSVLAYLFAQGLGVPVVIGAGMLVILGWLLVGRVLQVRPRPKPVRSGVTSNCLSSRST